jgi:hypothetical protein
MLDDSNFPAFLKVLSNNFSLKVLLWKKRGEAKLFGST